jgi:MFS family permease
MLALDTTSMTPDHHNLPPPPLALRWTALVVISLAMFGSSYIYDSIGPLAKVLADQLQYTNADIGLLQAICSVSSIFTVLLGGVIIDSIGVKKASMLFALICLAGAVITAASPRLAVMLAGRFLFGLGIGSLSIASTTSISQWFGGERLSFVFGLNLTITRLGSLAAQVSPTWAKGAYANWRTPLLIAIVFGVVSVLAMGVYWVIETQAKERYRIGHAKTPEPSEPGKGPGFSRSYWLAVLLCVTFYSGIFPFQTFAQKFFVEARGTAPEQASILVGLLTVIAMIATPLFGLLADRIGQRSLLLMLGSGLLVPVYLMMVLPGINLFIPMTCMGLSFSLIPAILWPSVILTVPHGKLGKALGLMSLIQSIGLTGFNFLIGWANDFSQASVAHPSGYNLGMWLFSATGLLAFLFALLLRRSEMGPHGHGLEFPSGAKPVRTA